MQVVQYPEYRDVRRLRVDVNNTVMGLLVGAHISSKVLELTDGSKRTLGELFPEIRHVRRFDMTPKDAKRILTNSESYIGQLALPAILAIHEDMIRRSVDALKDVTAPALHPTTRFNAKSMHSQFAQLAPGHLADDSMQVYNYVRNSRNKHVHEGGRADQEFEDDCLLVTGDTQRLWTKITGTKMRLYSVGDSVDLGLDHVIASLAVSKRLAEQANAGLQAKLPRQKWLDIIQDDWVTGVHAPKGANPAQRERKLRGFTRMFYGPLNLTGAEIAAIAAVR